MFFGLGSMGYSTGVIVGVAVCAVVAGIGIFFLCFRQKKLSKARYTCPLQLVAT